MMENKPCAFCGKEMRPPPYRITKAYWAKRKYCNDVCRRQGVYPPCRPGPRAPIEDRFWKKVQICEHGKTCRDCCWLWIGAKDASGYGLMYKTKRPKVSWYKSNRLAYELFIGPIPEGLHVLHDCPQGDDPACVNYNGHLWVGTQADNNADRDRKGRSGHIHRRGERNGRAILSDAQVAEMRRLYVPGKVGHYTLGKMFGCSEAQARRIVLYQQRV
jgi:hypothetical protein